MLGISCVTHLLVREGRLLVVSYLLVAGAQVNMKDRWAGTPLDDALRHNHDECAKALRSAGGAIGGREHSKFTTTDLIAAASHLIAGRARAGESVSE